MIEYLEGRVLLSSTGKAVVGVGQSGSRVGYSVNVPSNRSDRFRIGSEVQVHVHTHVREDSFDLYGFEMQSEKELFLCLIKCSGIGPKAALAMISNAGEEALVSAILKGDKGFLNGLPGVGKKTAERIVLDLSDLVQKKVESGLLSGETDTLNLKTTPKYAMRLSTALPSEVLNEAKSALVGLGYREQEVMKLLEKAILDSDENKSLSTVESVVKAALQVAG